MERYVFTAILVGFMIFMMWRSNAGKTDPEQVQDLVEAGAPLIDVRTPAEFASGHIEGARNIPVSEIGSRAHEVGDKDTPRGRLLS